MQDRYTGDLGDFSKLGILRALQAAGLSIGVNWYLTPDESHNGDGRHVKYLRQEEFKACDKVLWQELKNIVDSNHRKVCCLENENILPACFYSERLDFSGKVKAERESFRKEWHEKALAVMIGNSIVYLDPDNGLIVPSAVGKSKENKYVLHDELADYYAQQSSVIYYQHKARKPDQFYIRQHEEMIQSQRFPQAKGLALKFVTTSQRYYFFIIQPQHREIIERAVKKVLSTAWNEHFVLFECGGQS
jgi:hypothetical protein